jgi:endonuclease/exonuclease/phosphatase family metal-dependent hydrolase
MKIITWNVQNCRGCDGRIDAKRIVEHARALADFDVLCLQEVSDGFEPLDAGENQFARLGALLPGFTGVAGHAVDLLAPGGGRARFGNLLLTRLPVAHILRHALPQPFDDAPRSMPRLMLEATLLTQMGPLRVMTTHLEYFSGTQRAAQIDAIRRAHANACDQAHRAPATIAPTSPYGGTPHTASAILTGDFNFRPEDPLHATMHESFGDAYTPPFVDAWQSCYPNVPQPDTVGIYDRAQWPEAFACDFMFVTEDLLPRVERLEVETVTQASDHQPMLLVLGDV